MQDELALIERPAQLVEQRETPPTVLVSDGSRLGPLGHAPWLLQGDIEVAQRIVFVAMGRAGQDEADAGAEPDALLADHHRVGDELQEAAGKCLGIGEARRRIAEGDAEFVGTEACHDIGSAPGGAPVQAFRHGPGAVPVNRRLAMIFSTPSPSPAP